MNQAGSENKCSKRVSNESILNNYNFDDVSTDQNSICENCKQRGWTVCGKHSCHVGTVSNTKHVIEVAEVSQKQQTGTNNLCFQSLLQEARVYLQSVITSRMSGYPCCNPKSPSSPSVESLSQSSLVSFLISSSSPPSSASQSPSILSCMTSCSRGRSQCRPRCPRAFSPCPKPSPPCPDVKPICPYAKPPCLNAKPSCPSLQPPCSHAKPSSSKDKPSCLYAKPPCSNAKCPNAKPSCPSLQPPCPYAKPPCPYAKPPCLDDKCLFNDKPSCPSLHPPCLHAKPSSSKDKPACLYAKPPCSNAKCPNAKPSCLSLQPPCPYAKPPCPYAKPPCLNDKCLNAKPSCPSLQPPCSHAKPCSSNDKPACLYAKPLCSNAKCPNSKPSCLSLQPPCPYAKPPCPYAKPPCLNDKCLNAKPSCPSLQPPCSHAKPCSSNDKPACLYAKPLCSNAKCPNAKPSCLSLQPPCPKPNPCNSNLEQNSKTSLYHSFSNDSLCSNCKESLVQLAKVYIHKLTSDHKIRCPRCAKQPTCAISKETMASYLRSLFDQAWNYFNSLSIEKNTCPPQRVLSNCSNTFTSTRISESPSPDKSRCCCSKSPKTQSCEAVCCSKPVSTSKSVIIPDRFTCPICLTSASTKPVTCPRPVSCPTCLKPATCAKPAPCPIFYNCEETTSAARRSKEEGTHEHKYCYTPCCMHKSQGVQPSYNMSDKSCCSLKSSMNPLYISPSQIKTPKSVEELKASITGVTCLDKSPENMLGCDILDFRSTIEYSKPSEQDLRDLICATDNIPLKDICFSLTLEQQKGHTLGSRPKDLKHSKESLDSYEETCNDLDSCNDLEEQTRKEEVPCPSSGGRVKSNEVLLDKDFVNPTEQVYSKEKICKSSRNSVTRVDSNQHDPKDCNAPEKEAHRKDPYNYRYYY